MNKLTHFDFREKNIHYFYSKLNYEQANTPPILCIF